MTPFFVGEDVAEGGEAVAVCGTGDGVESAHVHQVDDVRVRERRSWEVGLKALADGGGDEGGEVIGDLVFEVVIVFENRADAVVESVVVLRAFGNDDVDGGVYLVFGVRVLGFSGLEALDEFLTGGDDTV